MLSVALLVMLASAKPLAVALPGFSGVRLDPGEAQLYGELFSQRLTARGVKVTTTRDMAAVLGLERQKALVGGQCDESCVAELAAALGVDVVVVGDLGRTDAGFAVGLKVISAQDASVLAYFSSTPADANALAASLDRAAWELLRQLNGKLSEVIVEPGPAPTVRSGALPVPRRWGLVPALIGIAGLGVGIGGLAIASGRFAELQVTPNQADALAAREAGKQAQALGAVGLTIGLAALVTGGTMLLLGEHEVEVAAWATPTAGGLALGARLQ